jgi:hypothetical protein
MVAAQAPPPPVSCPCGVGRGPHAARCCRCSPAACRNHPPRGAGPRAGRHIFGTHIGSFPGRCTPPTECAAPRSSENAGPSRRVRPHSPGFQGRSRPRSSAMQVVWPYQPQRQPNIQRPSPRACHAEVRRVVCCAAPQPRVLIECGRPRGGRSPVSARRLPRDSRPPSWARPVPGAR